MWVTVFLLDSLFQAGYGYWREQARRDWHPSRVIVLEIYTDAQVYATHLETPHFKKFRATTDKMVTSRKLLDAVPIVLGAKAAP